jgi:hypothetical protein
MRIFNNKSKKPHLTIEDFKLVYSKHEVKTNISEEFIKLLQKDGFGLNAKPGKQTSKIELRINVAKQNIWNAKVEIKFDEDDINDKSDFINSINLKLDWLEKNKKVIDKKIVSDLLTLKNESWLGDDESILDRESFISKIELKTIVFSEDLSFELFFYDGLMFGGHEIKLIINSDLRTETALI